MEVPMVVGSNKPNFQNMIIYKSSAETNPSDVAVYLFPHGDNFLQLDLGTDKKLIKIENLKQLVDSSFQSSTLISCSKEYSLLPNMSLENVPFENLQSFLKWNVSSEYQIHKSALLFESISIVYQERINSIANTIPSIVSRHILEILINYSLQQKHKQSITGAVINDVLALAVVVDGKLQLANIFDVSNNQEVIYFVMLMIQEFNLDNETCFVQLFGECEEKAYLQEHLSSFLRNLKVEPHPLVTNRKFSGLAQFIELTQ